MKVLELEGVHKSFRQGFFGRRRQVLRGVTLSLERGEVFGFLGHNGAGKSTTIKLILGLVRPDAGEVRVFGSDSTRAESRSRIGYLSEDVGVYPHFNAVEMLRLVGELFRIRGRELARRSDELLEAVGLAQHRKMKIRHYSKGMRQRLGVAGALFNDPELLLLDEPYSGLDPVGRRELRRLLVSLKERGKTIFMSSHVVPDVEAVCDRVGILSGGQIARSLDLNRVADAANEAVEVTVAGVDAERFAPGPSGIERVEADEYRTVVRCNGPDRVESVIKDVYRSRGTVLEVRRLRADLENVFMTTIEEDADAVKAH